MKKLFYVLTFAFVSTLALNAQYFIGGGFSFNTSGGNTEYQDATTDKTKTSSFNFYPMGGYILSDDIYIGVALNLGTSKSTTPTTPDETVTSSMSFGLTPFARYYALRFNKFAIFGQGQLGLSFSSSKTKVGGTTTDGPKTTTIGLNIFPGLSYDASEKIQLYTSINVLNFGFNYSVEKEEIGDDTMYDRTTSFGFGANLNNIVTLGNITVGAIYKF